MNNFDSLQINSIDYSTWIYRKHNSQTQHNKEQNELSDCLSSHRHPRFSSREARCSLPSDHAAPSQQVEEGEEASRGARRMQEHLEGTTRPCRVGIQPGSMGERKQGWGINGSHKILKQKQKNTKNTQKTHKKQNMVSKWMSWSNNCW